MREEINVLKVAKLARLKLQDDEEIYFKEKFNSIMDYVSTISEVEITTDMKEKDESLQIRYRSDFKEDSPVKLDQFSEYVDKKFFKVPRVIE
ncbi:MAG: aspartyl/glutamyl-tRNA amidotransferase subunit C [SAR324 cluster bacterium]|nr:aspartyl/glutamyl-tRNA amidotransferase subunit C [SAR324 cluster bacterium]